MTALVTGAGGAIGSAIVRQLLAQNVDVIAHDLNEVALEMYRGDPQVTIAVGNLLSEVFPEVMRTALDGRELSRVVAAHGVDGSGRLAAIDSSYYKKVMAINAESVVRLFSAVEADLIQSPSAGQPISSTFVIVSSQAGLIAEADNVAYSSSKFALIGWARSRRRALLRRGIAIRIAAPGCTETPLFYAAQEEFAAANGVSLEEFLQRRLDRIAVRRFASTDQTAAGTVYLSEPTQQRPFILAATGGEVRH
ncbi:SDR family NAD(P)-dependent oxidoreductase [Microbacterium sp. X-17]|uniref:SDR family NAD(P)-dependent oxidoreductase n=1 Tax=Microbacterium sp. X-17 TaxID=3144404 RepID=UPI0031F5730C